MYLSCSTNFCGLYSFLPFFFFFFLKVLPFALIIFCSRVYLSHTKHHKMVDKMDHDHDEEEQKQDSFEPLKQEFYEGKHLSAPVKEIEVSLIS
jgi:fatty acid desaturase